jgi:hypothetical protein
MVKHFHRKHFYKKAGTISTTRIIANEINLSDKIDSARFLAAQRKESNAWLHAFKNKADFPDIRI